MSELLQVIADRHTLFLTDLGNAIEDEARIIVTLPSTQQGRRTLDAARTSLGEIQAPPNASINYIAKLEERLKQGMNGNTFGLLVRTGDILIRECLAIVERVGRLWDKVEGFAGENDEVKEAREKISIARKQLLENQIRISTWRKLAERKPPEIDPAALERGAEQIRQGRFKTGEQILEDIRNRNSSK